MKDTREYLCKGAVNQQYRDWNKCFLAVLNVFKGLHVRPLPSRSKSSKCDNIRNFTIIYSILALLCNTL